MNSDGSADPGHTGAVSGARLESLYELSLALATTDSAEQIAARVLDAILAELDCADAWVVEIDPHADQFVALDGVGTGVRVLAMLSSRTAPPSWALLRAAEAVGVSWLSDRRQIESRLPAFAEAFPEVGALMLVPLRPAAESTAVGAVGLTFEQSRRPQDGEQDFLDAVGELAGQAVQRARLRRSEAEARHAAAAAAGRAERVGALAAALVAAQTPEQVAEVLATHVQRAVDSQTFSLRSIDRASQVASALGLGGIPMDYQERFTDLRLDSPSALAEVVATDKPVFVTSAEDNRRRYGTDDAVRYEVARIEGLARLPLLVEGELIAVLSVGYWEPREFDDNERLFLTTVSDLASQALGRAIRGARLRDEARRHRLLSGAQAAIVQRLDPIDQLRALSRVVVPELADFSSVHVLTTPLPPGVLPTVPVRTERVTSHVIDGVATAPLEYEITWAEGDPITQTIRAGRVVVPSLPPSGVPEWADRAGTGQLYRDGLKHLVLAPVLVDGLVVAVATFGMFHDRPAWDTEDLATIEQIADYAAVALTHGLAHQQSREEALLLAWRAALVDGLQDALFVVKPGGDIIEINNPFEAMLGYGTAGLPYTIPHPWWPDEDGDPEAFDVVRRAGVAAAKRGRGREVLPLRHRDGHRVWVDCSVETVPDREGSGTVLLGVLRDVTAAHRAAQRDALLAEVGSVLAQHIDLAQRLHTTLAAATTVLGEEAVLCLADAEGRLSRVATTRRDSAEESPGNEGPGPREATPRQLAQWASGEPQELESAQELAELVESVGLDFNDPSTLSSALVVPMVVEDRLFGLLTFLDSTPRRRDEADAALAQELGRRIVSVVQADRMVRREHQLNETSTALAAAATSVEAAAALAGAMTKALGVAGVAVYGIDLERSDRLNLLYTLDLPVEVTQSLREVDFDDPQMNVAQAVRTKQGVWISTQRAWHEKAPDVVQKIGTAKEAQALVALPLLVAGRVVGAVAAVFRTERAFPPSERSFAMTLATQAAQAFDRAALSDARWQAVQTELASRRAAANAAERAERLGGLAAALVATQTVAEVIDVLATHVQGATSCDAFSLREVNTDGTVARLARISGVSPQYVEQYSDVDLAPRSALSEVARTRTPVFVASNEEHYDRFGDPLAHHSESNVQALSRLPLMVEDELIAILSVGYFEPREFTDDERLFLTTVADLAAQAMGRAVRSARMRAEARRHRMLSAAQSAINQRLDPITQLSALAKAIVPELADFSSVQVLAQPVRPGITPRLPVITERVASEVSGGIEPLPHWKNIEWYGGDPLIEAIRRGGLLVYPVSTTTPPEWSRRSGHDIAFRHGVHHLVLAPVLVEGMIVAVAWFGVCNDRPSWDAEDLSIIADIAGFAALALEHGLSFQHTRETALVLQQSLLSDPPSVPELELAARYRPAGRDQVGGDWYDAFQLESGQVALAVGDVVGHDITAAAAMGQLRATLRTLAMNESLDPAAVLERLAMANRLLDITPFATAVFGRLVRLGTGWSLSWASAGHLPPLLIEPDGTARRLEVVAPGCALARGITPRYGVDRLRVDRPGTTLIFYTDGLVERRGVNIDDGIDALSVRASELVGSPIQDLCDGLLAGAPDSDDIALLIVRTGGTACAS